MNPDPHHCLIPLPLPCTFCIRLRDARKYIFLLVQDVSLTVDESFAALNPRKKAQADAVSAVKLNSFYYYFYIEILLHYFFLGQIVK